MIAHAVSAVTNNSYSYDCNGNMVQRVISGSTYNLSYDAENHLTGVTGPNLTATFVFDGDGPSASLRDCSSRVKSAIDTGSSTTTVYIGNYFEWSGSSSTMVKYYYSGSIRLGMRIGSGTGISGLSWILGDHLGSTSLVTDSGGARTAENWYKPWRVSIQLWQPADQAPADPIIFHDQPHLVWLE